jgi:hypothetical protein
MDSARESGPQGGWFAITIPLKKVNLEQKSSIAKIFINKCSGKFNEHI